MVDRPEIAAQRGRAAEILRESKAEVISRWMRKVRLLTREKGPTGFLDESELREDGHGFIDMLLAMLEGREAEDDTARLYDLILRGRQRNVRYADVAYVLLELKSAAKQIIFEQEPDELQAFRISRLIEDVVEALIRKSADVYELTSEADRQTAQARLGEIFSAWDLEEALVGAETPADACRVAMEQLGAIWGLAGWCVRLDGASTEEPAVLSSDTAVVPAQVREMHQFLTAEEFASGGVISVLDSVARRRETWVCPDVAQEERLANAQHLLESGIRSAVCCPLVAADRVCGVLFLGASKVDAFQPAHLRHLRSLSGVLALALDRTERIERSRKEISEGEVIARIGRSLLELPTREELLQGAVEALRAFRDYFDVSLFRVDKESGECVLVAEAGRGRRYRPDEYRQEVGQGFIGLCAEAGETIRAADLLSDVRRHVAFEEEYCARCELAVPVKRGDDVLGVIHFLSEREDDFPANEIAALEHVAPHIGVALQNARMIAQRRHDQYEIQQAREHLANIIRSTTVAITSTDASGVYTHWSPSCQALLGYRESEVVGRKTPADLAARPYDLARALDECLRQGLVSTERQMVRKDGHTRVIAETRAPLLDEDGVHVGFTSYLVDVTEQKRAEEQLRRERDTLTVVVGAMGAGLALYDEELRLHWANPTVMDWFGFGPEAIGKDCHELCAFGYCQAGTCPIEEAGESGRPVSRTHEFTDPRGNWRCYQQVFTPIAHGRTRLIVLSLDITEQRRQTEQMRLINRLTESVETTLDLDKVLHLVLTCVTAGHAIGLNRAFLFLIDEAGANLSGAMAVGPLSAEDAQRIWSDLDARSPSMDELLHTSVPSDGDERLTELVRGVRIPLSARRSTLVSTLNSRTGAHVGDARTDPEMDSYLVDLLGLEEFVCLPLEAPDRPLGVMLADHKYTHTPVLQEQVELLELFCRQASLAIANALAYKKIREQLTEIERTRDKLIEAERMASVGRMASHLAHEIRNPLAAIGGFAKTISRDHADDERTHRGAEIIYREARRLERQLVNVLDYTRPLKANKAPTSVNDIVRETVEEFAEQLRTEGIAVRMALADDVPPIMADAGMICQIVVNLIRNAMDAMDGKEGGRMTIATARGDGEVEIIVGDTGSGIEPSVREDLFSAFYTTKRGGVGLGLSICRRIAALHGGRIDVDSTLGLGSTFTVTLAEGDPEHYGQAERPESHTTE